MQDRPLNDLIQSYLDGITTAEEFGELQRRIAGDPVAADAFAKAARMDALLADYLVNERQMADSNAIATRAVDSYAHGDDYIPSPPRKSNWPLGTLAIAAAILAATGIGIWFAMQQDASTPSPQQMAQQTHQLLSGRVLVDGVEGLPIRDGSRIDVLDEPATLLLADGSRAELAPKSSAIVCGGANELRQVIALFSGGCKFQVEKGEGRFQVDTPIGPVTVLGTEFELQLQDHVWMGDDDMRMQRMMILSVVVLTGSVQVEIAGEQVTLVAGARQVFADEPRKDERRPEVTGRFVSYNAANNTLVVMGKEGRGEITFAVAKGAKVILNGEAGKLADLSEKHLLQLNLNADRSTVLEIRGAIQAADEPRRDRDRRTIVSVDAEKRTVTFKGERENVTLPIANRIRIFVEGREARLADLKPGVLTTVAFTDDLKSVVLLQQGEGKPSRRDGDGGDFRGQLEKFDEKANTIVVVQRGDGGAERRATLLLAKDVKVVAEGATGLKITDIAINTPISVVVNEDRTTAVSIRIELRPLRRIVFDVHGEKNTVTFRVERERITLPVSKEATITIDNRPAKLTDLKQGAVTFATMSPDGKTVVAINWRTPEGAKDGERPPAKDGERRKDAPKDGERRKDAPIEGERRKDAPKEGEQKEKDGVRTGTIIGDLKSRTDTKDGKNSTIEVLAPGEEKARSYFVNHDPAIKGPLPKVLEAVRAAKVGDRVEFEWVGTNHGPAITKFKVLPKRGEK